MTTRLTDVHTAALQFLLDHGSEVVVDPNEPDGAAALLVFLDLAKCGLVTHTRTGNVGCIAITQAGEDFLLPSTAH